MPAVEFRAMGTTVLATGVRRRASGIVGLFDHVEQICSRFLDGSELNTVNRTMESPVQLSPLLADVLAAAQSLRSSTNRLVDPAVGRLVAAWGYDRTFAEVHDIADRPQATPIPWWHVEGTTLWKAPGTFFDLGGIAKGWTADLGVELDLADVVNAGGDIRSARGDTIVDIEDPWGDIAASIRLGAGALATSSTTHRRWKAAGRPAHHLIDPRTGAPANSPALSATVVARTAVEAEAGAKAVLLLGTEGLAWADEQDWIQAALVVWHDRSVYGAGALELVAA